MAAVWKTYPFAENAGIPSVSLWASVPHYVASAAPSPKVTLALLDRLEELTGVDVDRRHLRTEAAAWEASIRVCRSWMASPWSSTLCADCGLRSAPC